MAQDRFGNPIDENGRDILDDDYDYDSIDEATDEELGFDIDPDFDFGLEYPEEFYAESYMTGDSDLMGEY